jgi:alpha-galactosidase
MDPLDFLNVRFHFNGQFLKNGNELSYVGGTEAMSYIDRDKLSLPEVVGHLRDHFNVKEDTMLHWLFPGRDMTTGLRALVDDKVCQYMSDCIVEGGVAEVYVEKHELVLGGYAEEIEDILDEHEIEDEDLQPKWVRITESKEEVEKQVAFVRQFYSSPNKEEGEAKNMYGDEKSDTDSDTDSEYIPGDSCSLGDDDDDETAEIYSKYKAFKKKFKRGEATSLDDVIYDGVTSRPQTGQEEDDGNCTPYAGSSDAQSFDELEDAYPRFNKNNHVVKFKLGMKFNSKKQFKNAAIKHGLEERRVILFSKDDPKRVRAVCDWKGCPWVCLLSNTSRCDSWQISTFNDNHVCPPRRDNKLVTSTRIAQKYEKFIFANPCWKLGHMLQTVQEEMFANVTMSKLKRAKALVMKKAFDATKGQYSRLYDYQMELLRSNPGSTVIVNKEDDIEPPIFRRMYICLDACKKGFKAGCRKVIGLDGCFFKGATNGELLCALGRDANNQMYPIAWAVVDKENNDNWDWFCDLLSRDIGVEGGKEWVFISDQQKVTYCLSCLL